MSAQHRVESRSNRRRSSFGDSNWEAGAPEQPLRYRLPVALPGTEFIFAHDCQRRWRVYHESYVMCLCFRASARWLYGGRLQEPLSDRCFILMEPGETHVNVEVPRPQTYVVLRIAPDAVARAAAELGVRYAPHFSLNLGHDAVIRRAFARLSSSIAEDDGALEQQSRFAHGMRLLLAQCIERPRAADGSAAGARRILLERCKSYLRERYNHSVSLDELAGFARLSRFHLLRAFQRAVGLPPHAYQLQIRVEHACRLLRTGVPPSLVASAVGFADQSHLTRHFRRVMFTTPGAYQAAVR